MARTTGSKSRSPGLDAKAARVVVLASLAVLCACATSSPLREVNDHGRAAIDRWNEFAREKERGGLTSPAAERALVLAYDEAVAAEAALSRARAADEAGADEEPSLVGAFRAIRYFSLCWRGVDASAEIAEPLLTEALAVKGGCEGLSGAPKSLCHSACERRVLLGRLGSIYFVRGDRRALDMYARAADDHRDAKALVAYGLAIAVLDKDWAAAAKECDEALNLDPKLAAGYALRCVFRHHLAEGTAPGASREKLVRSARADCAKALELEPGNELATTEMEGWKSGAKAKTSGRSGSPSRATIEKALGTSYETFATRIRDTVRDAAGLSDEAYKAFLRAGGGPDALAFFDRSSAKLVELTRAYDRAYHEQPLLFVDVDGLLAQNACGQGMIASKTGAAERVGKLAEECLRLATRAHAALAKALADPELAPSREAYAARDASVGQALVRANVLLAMDHEFRGDGPGAEKHIEAAMAAETDPKRRVELRKVLPSLRSR